MNDKDNFTYLDFLKVLLINGTIPIESNRGNLEPSDTDVYVDIDLPIIETYK